MLRKGFLIGLFSYWSLRIYFRIFYWKKVFIIILDLERIIVVLMFIVVLSGLFRIVFFVSFFKEFYIVDVIFLLFLIIGFMVKVEK